MFLERPGRIDISVDRLALASAEQVERVAEAMAEARGAVFYGWAVVTADRARESGRRVVSFRERTRRLAAATGGAVQTDSVDLLRDDRMR